MSFSNSGGGTLALPSPTHAHQIDVTSAVRNLRRSISRSPTKFLSRTHSHTTEGSRPVSPQSPSCRRIRSTPLTQGHFPSLTQSAPPASGAAGDSGLQPSLCFTPLRPGSRLSLRSAKSVKTASPSRLARARVSPKSPLRRALTTSPDAVNTAQQGLSYFPNIDSPMGQENSPKNSSRSPISRRNPEKTTRHSLHLDVTGASQTAFLKALDSKIDAVISTGTLKRSDATMNLDQPNQGSPMPKRRSLHGISNLIAPGSEDLNVFGPVTTTPGETFDIHEDMRTEQEPSNLEGLSIFQLREPVSSPLSNMPKRSSSLRKSTLQQRYGEKGSLGRRNGERQLAQMGSPDLSTPPRLRPRLSTEHFSPPSATRDSPFSGTPSFFNPSTESKPLHQPHPLSKTLSTSSSGNSLAEEQSFFAPARPVVTEKAKPHPFSRSLPLNATRPTGRFPQDTTSEVTSTPAQNNQLWLGAFNSTGLISKVNRNPEGDGGRKFAPPDTPCKKHSNIFATFPPPMGSASAMKKKKKVTNNRNSFGGLPSTPFNFPPSDEPDTFGNPSKGLSIFQRGSANRSSRRGNFLFMQDADDSNPFGDGFNESNPMEGDAPPTPTKNTLTPSLSNLSEHSSEHSLESPSAKRNIFLAPTSAVRPALFRNPTSESVASGRRTPQTPQESLLPLDTSRLSLAGEVSRAETGMPPPVTPTTGREDFRSSTSILETPVNGRNNSIDVDASLFSRFDKVEQVGRGEFSTVYRVTKSARLEDSFDLGSTTPLPRSPAKGQVYAVKKSRHPYTGSRDRNNKLREAHILRALMNSDHVVQYIDDWEHQFHFYIQTEFCEEGSLDKFLGNVGFGGRLDDFRIFKILQDLCLGLKEIHDAGFMHLDMKPANVLVTFEGSLKIGDFGLAQPIASTDRVGDGVDIEGDREYMAPEMLKGGVGPSADIFSLGLMILETAANVVLPDNGPSWIRLRSGDLSEVPSLTSVPSSEVQQDANSLQSDEFMGGGSHLGSYKRSELPNAPDFMVDAANSSSLDSIVRWMTAQEPASRPLVDQVLDLEGLRWVSERRSAPATVFEGPWGPAEIIPTKVSDEDTEMTDV
ncbi:unnamed protein product [Clonostachys rhizophaga]|uniref:Protein kinase domain-containing protein n=1 Tax=Clonostachys rhizophaga TaxID=160324 RepID=A0A9N9VAY5_9HYPO|nr:unnamed protein product [Clonostachys rhizophaga]